MTQNNFSSSYTSFTPLTSDAKRITSGFSITRLFDFSWRKDKKAIPEETASEEAGKKNDEGSRQAQEKHLPEITVTFDKKNEDGSTTLLANGSQLVQAKSRSADSSPFLPRKEKGKYRNVKTILRRLSAIAVDQKWRQTSGDFKHDFKQYWMPDEHCKECYECGGKFSTFRRRHHCRVCGQIFCSRCCSQEVPGQTMGFGGNIRVCNYCFKIVKAYLEDDIDKSLEALKEDIYKYSDDFTNSEPFGPGTSSSSTSRASLSNYDAAMRRAGSCNSLPGIIDGELRTQNSVPRIPFDAFGVTPKQAKDIKQDFLRDLWRQISDPGSKLELQSHRFRLKTYPNCFVGHELVDWLLNYGKAANRAQGVAIGQDLVEHGWIESVPATEENIFKDEYMLYQPGKFALPERDSQNLASRQELEALSQLNGDENESLTGLSVAGEDDDDETLPIWFRQISSETVNTLAEMADNQVLGTPSLGRRISSGRHLDLDHVAFEPGESKERTRRELSLQMKLDYFEDEDENEKQVRKEIYDQTNKLSLITHVPPPPLDTYVCVEGHPFVMKKKVPKVASVTTLVDDILRGIEFPKPRTVDPSDSFMDDNGESLARERLGFAKDHHLNALLNQLIERDNLAKVWKDVIMPIVRKISEKVVPDVRRDDDMDIRQYVWFKKVPTGDKPECQVISGVVFPKNVVHKKMNCSFTQPKILMLSCAIEYQRVENKLTSIDPVVLQEYKFLKNFIARVVTLKPNIVLVEKTVARVAQDMLLAAGITLVHNIKSNVMENISRCTGADVLQSMEQVSRPKLGSCHQFRLQKYPLPDGGSKTLMFFEGCAPDLGCSLVLQGGDKPTLTKVKAIMKYLIYVAYHLKLENKFLMDEFALPPTHEKLLPLGRVQNEASEGGKTRRAVFKIAEEDSMEDASVDEEFVVFKAKTEDSKMIERVSDTKEDDMLKESKKFNDLINQVLLSSSPFCVYPLPYLLTNEGRNCGCRRFIPGQLYVSRLLNNKPVEEAEQKEDLSCTREKHIDPDLIFKDPHVFTRPDIIPRPQDQITKCMLSDFRARGGLVDLKTYRDFEQLHKERRKEVNIKKKDQLEKMQKRDIENEVFEAAVAKKDKQQSLSFDENEKKADCFDPYNHQRIAVLFSSYSNESHNAPKPCISPWAVFMEFYGRNDITLGGFLERYCFRPSYICYSHNCDIEMIKHVRYFAHGNGSLYINMRNLDSPIPGYDRTILTWSWCKQCKQVTPVVPLSFESWSLSFAKYLELRFYGGQYKRRASAEPCAHSLHHDHYQYFSFANMVASFKYRPIELYEVIIPSSEVIIGKEREPMEWYHDVEEFCTIAEKVLIQISERINDLRHEDPSLNSNALKISNAREQRVKEFHSEFQHESYHFHEFMQCLKMKVDSLINSHDASHFHDAPQSPSMSEISDHVDHLILKPSEISALMTGIGNMLINLKKKLCEIILSWNTRLQEYIQQEKRREKTTKLSSSPKSEDFRYVPNQISNEIGEYYPTVVQDHEESNQQQENLKYTCINAQGPTDAVSEVLLDNGRILRQTYLGIERPKEYVASEIDNEEIVKNRDKNDGKSSSGELKDLDELKSDDKDGNIVDDEIERSEIHSEIQNESDMKEKREGLNIELNSDKESGVKSSEENYDSEKKNDEGKVGSPYMVIKSPLIEERQNDDDDDEQITDREKESFKRDYTTEHESTQIQQLDSKKLSSSTTNLKRTGSVQVERGSLSDLDLDIERKKAFPRMESEDSFCSSEGKEHWMAESRVRTTTVINTFENEDFPKYLRKRLNGMGQSDEMSSHPSSVYAEDGSEADTSDLISMQDVLDFQEDEQSYVSEDDTVDLEDVDDGSEIGLGESAVDYEFVHLDGELIEPISLTKELKSLGLSVDISSESPSRSSSPLQKEKDFCAGKSGDDDAEETDPLGHRAQQMINKVKARQFNKRKYPPLGMQLENSFDGNRQRNSESPNRSRSDDIMREKKKRQPLFEQEGSESEDAVVCAGVERQGKNKDEDFMNVDSQAHEDKKQVVKDDADLKGTGYKDGRMLGHRRLQSAPVTKTPEKPDKNSREVESELCQSPYELVSHTAVQSSLRLRSYSYGHKFDYQDGQDELTKIAERICQVDRKFLEMDDPEEIQYDESFDSTLKSDLPEKDQKMRESSGVFEDENERKMEHSRIMKSMAEADESEKDSVSSSTNIKIRESKDESEISKSGHTEMSQSTQSQKKGAEKMKKIISQFLPGSNFQAVPIPFPPHEHYLLAAGDSVSVVINEQEPSSIIAYALSSVDYDDQLIALKKKLFSPRFDEVDLKQSSISPKNNLELNTNEVVLRNRIPQSRNMKRPSSWGGISSKNPFLDYQINFQNDSAKQDNFSLSGSTTGLDSKPTLPRNRMSLIDPFITPSNALVDTAVSSETGLDSPAEFDDAKTDSMDGILDDKDDLESVVSDARPEHAEKTRKKKDESKPSIDCNIKLQFDDNSAKFFCNVYYAEQFRLLRELIFPEGEERYIQSLSRCVFWKARGGKSGSSFSKSLDDRFVMKQMSRLEVQSFVEFAPHYFQYMDKALKEQRPTTLAKILGVYRIGFKNSQTNATLRQDVLIMENVFYNRRVNKIFDLKGSVRSRYVHNSGKEEVLMDENLLEMICETPLFIRPHSKVILSKAIHNDSEFLANHSVMDYSLLVGIDEVKFELVVGIIDYIRTFTWDKKLESYVKSTGILGGQGKMPTVVSPAVYRTRFTEAMQRYFLMVPDKWMGFGADLN